MRIDKCRKVRVRHTSRKHFGQADQLDFVRLIHFGLSSDVRRLARKPDRWWLRLNADWGGLLLPREPWRCNGITQHEFNVVD